MAESKSWNYHPATVPRVYTEKHFLFLMGTRKRDFFALTEAKRDLCFIESIEKKSGGYREIWKPRRDLKKLQAKVNRRYLSRLSFPDFIHCGPQGRFIGTAARGHNHFDHHLSLDVTAFFDSISEPVVRAALKRAAINSDIAGAVVRVSIAENKLPQGFPTSSILSALVMSQALEGFYSEFERGTILLSVYADDILLSSNDPALLDKAKAYIVEKMDRIGLILNNKEHRARRGEALTWLSLQIHPWVALPRKALLELEKTIYEYKMTGVVPADFKPRRPGNLVEQWEESLKGKAIFAGTMNRSKITDKALKRLAS